MNNYQILGVTEIVSKDELKKAHRKLLKKYHPDKFTGDKAFAEQKTREINAAYTQILADLEKCEKQTLKAKKPQKTTEEKRHFNINQFFASIKKPNESKEPNLDNLETAAKKEETDYNYYASLPVENNSSLVSNLYRTKEELKKEKKAKLALDITICVLTALTLTVILLIAL